MPTKCPVKGCLGPGPLWGPGMRSARKGASIKATPGLVLGPRAQGPDPEWPC